MEKTHGKKACFSATILRVGQGLWSLDSMNIEYRDSKLITYKLPVITI